MEKGGVSLACEHQKLGEGPPCEASARKNESLSLTQGDLSS